MSDGLLSFDFSEVKVSSGPSVADIPTGVALYATVDKVEFDEFNGVGKFVFTQSIFVDPSDRDKSVPFKTYIGPKHGWLLAQYLDAANEDFRILTGQELSASALQTVLGGHPFTVYFKDNSYQDKNGVQRNSKQITKVTKFEE